MNQTPSSFLRFALGFLILFLSIGFSAPGYGARKKRPTEKKAEGFERPKKVRSISKQPAAGSFVAPGVGFAKFSPAIGYSLAVGWDTRRDPDSAVRWSYELEYWGFADTESGTDSSTYNADAEADYTARLKLQAISARTRLQLGGSFNFIFGVGHRYVESTYKAESSDGLTYNASKAATSIGGLAGVSNRWFINKQFYFVADWVAFFVPVYMVSSKVQSEDLEGIEGEGKSSWEDSPQPFDEHDGYQNDMRQLVMRFGYRM
jgi:hypothetical protein